MADEGGDKSHDPTPRRREDARQKGQVARSQDLAAAIVLLCAIVLLMTLGKQIAEAFREYSEAMLSDPIFLVPENAEHGLRGHVMGFFLGTVVKFMKPLSLFFLALMTAAILSNIAQVGFQWLPDKLTFDITKLDPIKGFGRIFSMQSVIRLVMGIIKVVICAVVAYYAIKNDIGTILNQTQNDDAQIAAFLMTMLLNVALKVAVALLLLAILDFMYQKWKHEQDLRMSTQEIREEMKNSEGDPQILGKRRQLQREMAMQQRNVSGTSDADVVVTNPTHYAVALKFDPKKANVPFVVAKGADFLALQIRRIALENNIPIFENKPLAQALYKTVEVGQPVLDEQYHKTLAEIMAHAYRITKRNISRELQESEPSRFAG